MSILKLSVSKTKSFSDCQKKFHFAYVLKLPRKDFLHFTLGKFVHKILEDFHAEYLNGSQEPYSTVMSKVYKVALNEVEFKDKLDVESKKEAYSIIDKYLRKISIDQKQVSSVISVEKKFDLNIGEVSVQKDGVEQKVAVVLNGMIDRIQMDPDGIIHVCDYKTTKNKSYLKNDFVQLLTYAYAIYQEDPTIQKIRGSYILLRHNFEYLTKEFNIQEILAIKEKYEKYASDIENETEWKANPTKLCAYCDFIDSCPEGSKLIKPKLKFGETKWA